MSFKNLRKTFICLVATGLLYVPATIAEDVKMQFDTVLVRNDSMFWYMQVRQKTAVEWNGRYFYLHARGPYKLLQNIVDGYEFVYNQKRGNWEYYFDNGQIWKRGNYKEGLEDGVWIEYYPGGKVFRKRIYKKGNEDGIRETYDEQGNLLEKKSYKAGIFREGGKELHYNEDGVKFQEAEINRKGVYDGKYTEWWPNGKVKKTGYYKEGKDYGKWVFYSEEGKVEGEAEMIDPANFVIVKYYEGGEKKMEGKVVNGELEGPYTEYYRTGKVEKTGSFHAGKKEGEWKYFDLDGKVIKTEIYKEDLLTERKFD